jgi:Tripartite tricarboxylate transporter TctB family
VNSNRVAAAAVAAIAVALYAATYWFDEMPEGITRGFGAEVFPRLVLGTIIALSIGLAFIPAPAEPLPRIPRMVWYSGGALFLFMALVPVAGMLPTMFLFLIGVGALWGERRYWLLILAAALLTAAIWGVFIKGFGVQLPKGMFL